ncbi:MAG: sigma-70 family RNA polymerase sigma factor [Candidatus Peregrinibacteria bacterium]
MVKSDFNERKDEIESLVGKVQEGDHDAFSVLYDIFINHIYRYVYYRVKSGDAEDLTETVFLKVWENINKYKPQKRSFSAWVFRIAHNLVVDYYRASKDRDFDELKIDIPDYKREHSPINNTEKSIDQDILRQAIGKLKKAYREIVVYKFVNELTNSEISEILNKSEGSVRILQYRALKALRRELDDMGAHYDV